MIVDEEHNGLRGTPCADRSCHVGESLELDDITLHIVAGGCHTWPRRQPIKTDYTSICKVYASLRTSETPFKFSNSASNRGRLHQRNLLISLSYLQNHSMF